MSKFESLLEDFHAELADEVYARLPDFLSAFKKLLQSLRKKSI